MLIGFVGFQHSGKSTCADHLCARYGFSRVSPIDPVKRLAESLGFTSRSLWGSSSARSEPHPTLVAADGSPLTARRFLDESSAAIRAMCPDILLAAAMRHEGLRVVNESVRLHAEMNAIRAAGGKLVLRRGGVFLGNEYDTDVAETVDSEFDAIIEYQPALADLHARLDALMREWGPA